MRRVLMKDIYHHPIVQKYVRRSGMAHAIAVGHYVFDLALEYNVNPDWAVKAGFLHDIGHYDWSDHGGWNYQLYRECDIHPIKGAERAHKLLVRLGEDQVAAKEISHAVLLHTDSVLPKGSYELSHLQKVVHLADERDKEPGDGHHYRSISRHWEERLIHELDLKISSSLSDFA
ncbi:HD domain-containing protein [Aquisalibacillus elongatus]|uniref:HD domain-containing protein n=1 Tax=Aquisalibacillus elongatus TaxID=485577 RepID=UPI000F5392DF|nr:HD domain-containing protein [Aquisalibacillus elongatus]